MADARIQYSEEMVGAGHPAKADTLNRLTLVEHNADGTHDRLTNVKDPWIDPRAFGAAADGTTDDTAAIQAAVDFAGTFDVPGKVDLAGLAYACTGDIVIRPGITFRNGEINGSIRIGETTGERVDFKNPAIENIRFMRTSLSAGTYAIKIANAYYFGTIRNCKFENVDIAIWQPSLPVSYSQNSHRGIMTGNFYNNVNYFIKGEKPTGATFGFADITITDNIGQANINHIRLEGVDGAIIANNTTFFNYPQSSTKEQTIYIDYGGWVKIDNNQIFESGYEGIYLSHTKGSTVSNNSIIWPGQREPRSGIKFANGDTAGDVYCLATVTGNHIEFATLHSIEITDNCGYITITGNNVRAEGSSQHYYGTTDLGTLTHYGITSAATARYITAVGNQTSSALNNILGTRAYYAHNYDSVGNAQARQRVLTLSGTETAVDVSGYEGISVNQSAPTTITAFNNGYDGQTLYLIAFNGNTTVQHNANIRLSSGANTALSTDKTMVLRLAAGRWYQV